GAGEGSVAGGGGSRRRQGDGRRPASPDFRERAVQLACCVEGRGFGYAAAGGGAVHPAGRVWRIGPSRYSDAGAAEPEPPKSEPPRPMGASDSGVGGIEIVLPNGARVSVDAFVNEKALSRVLRAMKGAT